MRSSELLRRPWLVALALVALATVAAAVSQSSTAARPATDGQRAGHQPPNIIVIQTDDQDTLSMTHRVMPNAIRSLAHRGTTFNDYVDSGPLCCPSRAVMLTGQYGHNNGVLWNDPDPYGDLVGKDNTLPVWLNRAGYRTAHIGRYLNNYARATGDPNQIAPGWDQWDTVLEESGGHPIGYYDYTLHENGHSVPYGSAPSDYVTRVLDEKAVGLIHRWVPRRRPAFIALDQIAPHSASNLGDPRCQASALPAPRDGDLFANKPLPRPPSFNEADVSDKPWFIRVEPRLTQTDIAQMTRRQDCRLASLREVDRGIRQIVSALRQVHELGNTAIFYTSDNGYMQGEHREHAKVDPYEEALHVPLIVRLPRRFRGPGGAPRTLSSTVANVDIAPTILRLAQARPCQGRGECRVLDGRSLLKAIRSDGRTWPHDRGILLELKGARAGKTMACDYQGIRTTHQVFVRYLGITRQLQGHGPCVPDNEAEYYNLRRDPYQLANIYPARSGTHAATEERELANRLDRLRDCAGIKGRDPGPGSGHYCE